MGILWYFNLEEYIQKYKLTTFIECGTGVGDGLLYAQIFSFKKIYTCELLPELMSTAKSRTTDPRISFMQGTSEECLERLLPELKDERILFWCDAHFPGMDFSKDRKIMDVEPEIKLPLETELRIIKKFRSNNRDVILIDDVKIYLPDKFEIDNRTEKPLGNINFVYELFDKTHNISIDHSHDGYLILEPKEKVKHMNIAFYSNRCQFDGDFLERQGLGGSESALINLSSIWKQKYPEDEVAVFNSFQRNFQIYNGVVYKGIIDFKSECKNANWDAFISLRDTEPLYEPYIDSKILLFWSEDDTNEIGIQTIASNKYLQAKLDSILVISNHSMNDIKRIITTPLFLMRNGYREDWINPNPSRREPLAIYTSTPYRGLDVLDQIWPAIVVRYNELIGDKTTCPRLRVITGMGLYQQNDGPFKDLYDRLDHRAFVQRLPPVPQKELYNHLREASVMLYPNHFLETGCMSVTEALANNVWVVTSNLGALPEQVVDGKNGFIIDGDARSRDYKEKFIEKAAESLVNRPIPNNTGLIFSWQQQVELLKNYIYNLLK